MKSGDCGGKSILAQNINTGVESACVLWLWFCCSEHRLYCVAYVHIRPNCNFCSWNHYINVIFEIDCRVPVLYSVSIVIFFKGLHICPSVQLTRKLEFANNPNQLCHFFHASNYFCSCLPIFDYFFSCLGLVIYLFTLMLLHTVCCTGCFNSQLCEYTIYSTMQWYPLLLVHYWLSCTRVYCPIVYSLGSNMLMSSNIPSYCLYVIMYFLKLTIILLAFSPI